MDQLPTGKIKPLAKFRLLPPKIPPPTPAATTGADTPSRRSTVPSHIMRQQHPTPHRIKTIKTISKAFTNGDEGHTPLTHKSNPSLQNGEDTSTNPSSRTPTFRRNLTLRKERHKSASQVESPMASLLPAAPAPTPDLVTRHESEMMEEFFNPTSAPETPGPRVTINPANVIKRNTSGTDVIKKRSQLRSTASNITKRNNSFRGRRFGNIFSSNNMSRPKLTAEELTTLCKKFALHRGSDLLIQMEQLFLDGKDIEAENLQTTEAPPTDILDGSIASFRKSKQTNLPLAELNWSPSFKTLSIKNSSVPLLQKPFKLREDTLQQISFSSLTKFKNIDLVSRTCLNLRNLTFSNVILLQKPREDKAAPPPPIDLLSLQNLSIVQWFFSLTPNEYWLMEWLSKYLNAPKLKSLTFHGANVPFPEKLIQDSQAKLNGTASTDAQTLICSFLEKPHSIQNLSFGGLGFQSRKALHFAGVQPISLRLDLSVDGAIDILKAVKRLESLIVSGTLGYRSALRFKALMSCIGHNSKTLKILKIFPWFSASIDNSNKALKLYNFDCGLLSNCTELEILYVNITMTSQRLKVPCGKIYDLQFLTLPKLSRLELYNEEFRSEELGLFGKKLSGLEGLKWLVLSGNNKRQSLYEIPKMFVNGLLELKQFSEGTFFGGKFEDLVEMKRLIPAESEFNVEISEDYVFIYRSKKIEMVRVQNSLQAVVPTNAFPKVQSRDIF